MVCASANKRNLMKVKIKITYEWEEDLTEIWETYKDEGSTLEKFKNEMIRFNHGINSLDTAAANHINRDYQRDLEIEWRE